VAAIPTALERHSEDGARVRLVETAAVTDHPDIPPLLARLLRSTGHGVTGPCEADEAFAVDVQQIAGTGPPVAARLLARRLRRPRDPGPPKRPPDSRVRVPGLAGDQPWPQPLRRLAAQIRACSTTGSCRGLRCGREDRSSRQPSDRRCSAVASDQRRHHLQAVVGETPRPLAASLQEQPDSTSATSARRPASPRRALR